MSVQDIADRIFKDQSTVSPLVDKLVSLGLAKKSRSDEDARIRLVTLTASGRAIRARAVRISCNMHVRLYRGLEGNARHDIIQALARMNANLGGGRPG